MSDYTRGPSSQVIDDAIAAWRETWDAMDAEHRGDFAESMALGLLRQLAHAVENTELYEGAGLHHAYSPARHAALAKATLTLFVALANAAHAERVVGP